MRRTRWRTLSRRRSKRRAALKANNAMASVLNAMKAIQKPSAGRDSLAAWMPRLVIAPSAIASFVYVFVFVLWTLYLSMSDSTLLPSHRFVGLKPYFELWANKRWTIAYVN